LAVSILASTAYAQSGEFSNSSLQTFLQDYLEPPVRAQGQDQRYSAAFVDLKDDGKREVIAYLSDRDWCGSGGCTTLVLAQIGSDYQLISKITVTRLPIRVLNTRTNGWHDLSVVVGGGGIRAVEAKLSFDGRTYPNNPSTAPAVRLDGHVAGTVVIATSSQADPGDSRSGVEQVLLAQQDAWNHHDLDAFMSGYWNSPELTFFSDAKQTSGWQATLDRYRATYSSPGHEMGKLDFSDLRIEMLGPKAAFVRGAWHLTLSNGKTPHGRFTLIFRKFPDGWKIIHDHTSAAAE
jgi:ketosteroid isomerase-like protein